MFNPADYSTQLQVAVGLFWSTRGEQAERSQAAGAAGASSLRGEVTGGRHLDGIEQLIAQIVRDSGIPDSLLQMQRRSVPGYFRRTKDWDLAILVSGRPMAIIELKSMVGPDIGKNFNNRTDEALGQAIDVWKAAEHGLLGRGSRLWIGYLMVLEDNESAHRPTATQRSAIFPPDPVFDGASHSERFRIFFERMMDERLLDAACVVLTPRDTRGCAHPSPSTSFAAFVAALHGRVLQFRAMNPDLDWPIG
jgi:Restriction endonuclease XhoI